MERYLIKRVPLSCLKRYSGAEDIGKETGNGTENKTNVDGNYAYNSWIFV